MSEFKPIPDDEGIDEVSDDGRVNEITPWARTGLAYISTRCSFDSPFLVVEESLDEIPPTQVAAIVRENPDGTRRLKKAVFKAMGWTGE